MSRAVGWCCCIDLVRPSVAPCLWRRLRMVIIGCAPQTDSEDLPNIRVTGFNVAAERIIPTFDRPLCKRLSPSIRCMDYVQSFLKKCNLPRWMFDIRNASCCSAVVRSRRGDILRAMSKTTLLVLEPIEFIPAACLVSRRP